eukprot:TRINITY_DN3188_c0_g1_i12.p3 TRINITY_DN3188_c0_g1~~TRINITY_DN3188_c0_g1_i12.p3  ORF type:complete len:123 (-),score=34.83 TRINITY_DN3188_c0_g1_i12:200-568(-)
MALLGIRAQRTVRAVLWTCEEFGGYGGMTYALKHESELDKTSLAIELDDGAYVPLSLQFAGSQAALDELTPFVARVQQLVPLAANITLITSTGGGVDIDYVQQRGVPVRTVAQLTNHHTSSR